VTKCRFEYAEYFTEEKVCMNEVKIIALCVAAYVSLGVRIDPDVCNLQIRYWS
jgi:hypothetical protein